MGWLRLASGGYGMKTALTWIALIGAALIGWLLGNPPWLQTLAIVFMICAVVISFGNLEEKVADLRYENDLLKEDLEAKERWIEGLETRVEGIESRDRAA
jgi:hypothetical protein